MSQNSKKSFSISIIASIIISLFLSVSLAPVQNVEAAGPNLIQNGSFETTNTAGLPTGWLKGGYGTNTRIFSYPVAGLSGGKAAKVEITSRSSGDAKWYFSEVAVKPNTKYTFSNAYISNVSTFITVQYKLTDGSFRWVDIAFPAPASSFTRVTKDFTTPSNVASLTIFHLLNKVGTLTVDDYSLTEFSAPTSKGLLTLNFDDGWRTTHQNALPILKNSGVKGSFYITSRFDFPAYIDRNQTLEIQTQGHEVGSHTRNHVDLTTVTLSEADTEIKGSVADLKALGINSVETFAYPFGAYNSSVETIIKSVFKGARTSDGGLNNASVSPYRLRRHPMNFDTTLAQTKAWIDQAIANDQWLVLVFHRVDYSNNQYSTTPEILQSVIDYAKSKNISIVTTSEGLDRVF